MSTATSSGRCQITICMALSSSIRIRTMHPSLITLSRQPPAPKKDPPDDFDELKPLNDNVLNHKHCLLSLGLPPLPPPALANPGHHPSSMFSHLPSATSFTVSRIPLCSMPVCQPEHCSVLEHQETTPTTMSGPIWTTLSQFPYILDVVLPFLMLSYPFLPFLGCWYHVLGSCIAGITI